MIASESLTLKVVDALSECSIPYFLAGSFASNYYGIPRSTKDADFVVQTSGGVGSDFVRALGTDFEVDPQLSFETVTGTFRQNARHRKSPFKIELFVLSKDPHDQERFSRRQRAVMFGREVWLLSAEDVIVSKLRWARSKDEEDIRNVISVQDKKLDWSYIHKWCELHGTSILLAKIRQTVPEI